MPTAEGDITTTTRASPTSITPHPSPPSNPATPTSALPQYFQPLQNAEHSTNVMVKGNQQHQQTLIIAPQPTLPLVPGLDQQTLIVAPQPVLPLVPGLDAASYESHIQAPLPNDGSSSVGSKEAVILGLQALERQQEELERKRAYIEAVRKDNPSVRRDNPFDALPQHDERSRQPQDFAYQGDVPSMVHLPTDEDDSQKNIVVHTS